MAVALAPGGSLEVASLSLDELQALEWQLRNALLTQPTAAERQRRDVEMKSAEARIRLAQEIDELDVSADGLRAELRALQSATDSLTKHAARLNADNAELRAQVQKHQALAASARAESAALIGNHAPAGGAATGSPGSGPKQLPPLSPTALRGAEPPPSPASGESTMPDRLRTDEAEGRVVALRREHAELAAALHAVSHDLSELTAERATKRRQLETLQALQAKLDTTDATVRDATALQAQHTAKAKELEDAQKQLSELASERRAMVAHLCSGFLERGANLAASRRRYIDRVVRRLQAQASGDATSPLRLQGDRAALEGLLQENHRLRNALANVVKDSAAEREQLYQYEAVLRQRTAEAIERLEHEAYRVEVAQAIRATASPLAAARFGGSPHPRV